MACLAAAAGATSVSLGDTITGISPREMRHCRASMRPGVFERKPMAARASRGTTPTITGCEGLYFEMRRAATPLAARHTIALAFVFRAVCTAELARLSMSDMVPSSMLRSMKSFASLVLSMQRSASRVMEAMMVTASTGKAPAAVSPDSMTESVPSSTALATSVASARVGRGLLTMDSSICVAVTTGLPAMLQRLMMSFCTSNIFSSGISMPRSPRATMMPSDSRMISSMLSSASWFSILEMMRTPESAPSVSRTSCTSLALRTNDAARKSMPSTRPHSVRSALSFSVSTGRFTMAPGRLQFLRSPMVAVLRARACTVPASGLHDSTSNMSEPSAHRIFDPGLTVDAMSL
mmetsp:Transcript_14076/g.58787  ORF Transcript_14076/g.58787 Transcript_14076/m.58787 type:complete len:350 (-) Transcript_14076:500-1549(-)